MNRRRFLQTTSAAAALALIPPEHLMAKTTPRRVLWAANVRTKPLNERLIAANEGGFDAMSVFPIDYKTWRAEGMSAAQIRSRFADAGVDAAIVDPFVQWVPDFAIPAGYPSENIAFIDHSEADVFAMADGLGASQMNIVEGLGQQYERTALIDALGGLTDRAAVRGLRLGLEPMPISSIATLAQGWDLVQAVGRDSLGLTFDTWHFWRADPDHDLLRTIPGSRIFDVQLADATTELKGDLLTDLLRHRLLAGDGDFDLETTVSILKEIGAYRQVGPELFSDAMDALDASEVGRRTGRSLTDWS